MDWRVGFLALCAAVVPTRCAGEIRLPSLLVPVCSAGGRNMCEIRPMSSCDKYFSGATQRTKKGTFITCDELFAMLGYQPKKRKKAYRERFGCQWRKAAAITNPAVQSACWVEDDKECSDFNKLWNIIMPKFETPFESPFDGTDYTVAVTREKVDTAYYPCKELETALVAMVDGVTSGDLKLRLMERPPGNWHLPLDFDIWGQQRLQDDTDDLSVFKSHINKLDVAELERLEPIRSSDPDHKQKQDYIKARIKSLLRT